MTGATVTPDTETGAEPSEQPPAATPRWRSTTALAAVIGAALTVLAAVTADDWQRFMPGTEANQRAGLLMLWLLLSALTAAVITAVRARDRVFLLTFGAWAGLLLFLLLGQWPGIVEPDTIQQVELARSGTVDTWYSVAHALMVLAAMELYPHAATLALFQVVLIAGAIAYASTVIHHRASDRRPLLLTQAAFLLLVIPVTTSALHLTRDTWAAAVLLIVATRAAELAAGARWPRRSALVVLFLGTAALGALRTDALVVGPTVLVLLAFGLRPSRRQLAEAAAILLAASAVWTIALPRSVEVTATGHAYEMTLIFNPLGAILKTPYATPDRALTEQRLSKVIDIERTVELQTPSDIQAYWQRAWREPATEQDWEDFMAEVRTLVLANVSSVVGNRVEVLLASAGLGPGGHYGGTEDLRPKWSDRVRTQRPLDARSLQMLTAEPPVQALYGPTRSVMLWSQSQPGDAIETPGPGAWLWWNFLPLLLLLLLVALRWRPRGRRAAPAFAIIVLCRAPLLIAAAPIPQSKYYAWAFFAAPVALGLWLADRQASRRATDAAPTDAAPSEPSTDRALRIAT